MSIELEWLTKLSSSASTDNEKLIESLEKLPGADAAALAKEIGLSRAAGTKSAIESGNELLNKVAFAHEMGRELAHSNPDLFEKTGGVASWVGKTLMRGGRSVARGLHPTLGSPTLTSAAIGAAPGALYGGLTAGPNESMLGGALRGAAVGGALGAGARFIPGVRQGMQNIARRTSSYGRNLYREGMKSDAAARQAASLAKTAGESLQKETTSEFRKMAEVCSKYKLSLSDRVKLAHRMKNARNY